ncbi:type VI secretion system baseplate subunit TssK [Halopseudomonas maritima]|uniref:type VI secretion system baseplate subunit TssK n=1 Tax=Halopseudomonas maritima TaxID=2918528 RepID=UPI001EEA370F|nr:type VI secretion system baseplate subunit TssK [Halopseudomonas maritima]UJJ31765.1 type VI secretion system baseplate subunit TssK [Halopseudomonas maritima]
MPALKVVWHEGMLLRPQHFQQHDRYYDEQLTRRTNGLHAHAWGFTQLTLDSQFLALGKIVITDASGLLPDGSLFDLSQRPEPLALDVPPGTLNSPVYLALPLVSGGHVEVQTQGTDSSLARYVSTDHDVSDANAGAAGSATLRCAQPAFRLMLGEAKDDQALVRLRLCQIQESNSDGSIRLDDEQVASYLHCQDSPFLQKCLQEAISLVQHRADALAERLRSRGKAASAELGDLLMLQLLNRHEPLLRQLRSGSHTPPAALFSLLLSLLGELSTFSCDSKRPPTELHYQHSDQGGSFRQLMRALRQSLSMVLEQHALELPLQQRQYGIRVAPLSDPALLDNALFVLAAKADCDSDSLRKRLPNHLKIGAVEQIRQLVNLHLPGIRLRALPVAPRQLPFHSDRTYFALELSADERAQLASSGGFAFHAGAELSNLQLAFWAIRS